MAISSPRAKNLDMCRPVAGRWSGYGKFRKVAARFFGTPPVSFPFPLEPARRFKGVAVLCSKKIQQAVLKNGRVVHTTAGAVSAALASRGDCSRTTRCRNAFRSRSWFRCKRDGGHTLKPHEQIKSHAHAEATLSTARTRHRADARDHTARTHANTHRCMCAQLTAHACARNPRLGPTTVSLLTQVWRGIPYAQPPVGDLRFRPPLPPSSWVDARDAIDFGPSCLQMG